MVTQVCFFQTEKHFSCFIKYIFYSFLQWQTIFPGETSIHKTVDDTEMISATFFAYMEQKAKELILMNLVERFVFF